MNIVELNTVIDNLATKLAIPVEAIFEALPVIAKMSIICFGFKLLAIIMLSCLVVKLYRKCVASVNDHNTHFIYITAIAIISFLDLMLISTTIENIPDIVLYMLDKNAWTVKYLFGLLS